MSRRRFPRMGRPSEQANVASLRITVTPFALRAGHLCIVESPCKTGTQDSALVVENGRENPRFRRLRVPLALRTRVFVAFIAVAIVSMPARAAAQGLLTTYYPTFGAETPTSSSHDSGGYAFAEYWLSTGGLFNLSEEPEHVVADEVLGDPLDANALALCLGDRIYQPGQGNFASCGFWGQPRFVRLRHGEKILVDAQVMRYRVASCASPSLTGLPQGFAPIPTYQRLYQPAERTVAGPVELRTQNYPPDCATSNQAYNRRVNITLANYGQVPATFTIVAYPLRRFDGPYEPVWIDSFVVEARRVLQVNDVPIPRTLTDPQVNRRLGSMSVWLTITSDQPYLGYVSSVFEGGEPGSLPFQVFPLRGAETAPTTP